MVWNVFAMVANFSLKRSVTLHDELYRFRAGMGMGNETSEAKLAHKFTGITHHLLFQYYLDVQKAYDSIDRGR